MWKRNEGNEEQETDLDVAVSLEVKDGERAHVSDSIDEDGELAEEVDDLRGAGGEGEPENERREDDRERLLHKDRDLHREQLA